ncbi:MAG: hypothetical protein OXU81_00560 [Gammaproteobacteria bacterium]|nr:hypothetical protein [Gammaproteobacteria bacterium]
MELIEQLGMLLGDRVLGLPSNQGTVFRCGLEYLENDLSESLVVFGVCMRGLHPFRSSRLVGLLTLGPSRSRMGKTLEIRTDSEEPIAQLIESRPVDDAIAQIEPKNRGRAFIGPDPLGRRNLGQFPEFAPGECLADVPPCFVQIERRVDVSYENFGLPATFLSGGLDIVFEDVLPDAVGVFGRPRRFAVKESAILRKPAAPAREPVEGVLGVGHQNPVVLSPIASVFAHAAQPFSQRLETVSFPGFVQIPERHSKLVQFLLDRPDRESTGVPPAVR